MPRPRAAGPRSASRGACAAFAAWWAEGAEEYRGICPLRLRSFSAVYRLPKCTWNELNDGVVKYSFEDEKYYVPEGETASLSNYQIDAGKSDVIIGDNFKIKGDSVYLEGDGFEVSFNSPQPQISLASA